MSSLSRELVFLILQFLEEEKFKESLHRLVYFLYLCMKRKKNKFDSKSQV